MKRNKPGHRNVYRISGWIFVCMLLSITAVWFAGCGDGSKPAGEFNTSAEKLLERSRTVLEKSETFNQYKVLRDLRQNGMNGQYFRFDDNLSRAKISFNTGGQVKPGIATGIEYNFDSDEAEPKRLTKGDYTLDGGIFKTTYTMGQYLIIDGPPHGLGLRLEDLSRIVIRARHSKGRTMSLYLNPSAPDTDAVVSGDDEEVIIDLSPGDELNTYRVSNFTQIAEHIGLKKPLASVAIRLSDVEGDPVEIDSVNYVFRQEVYQKKGVGTDYVEKNDDRRTVLHTVAGVDLTYDMMLPASEVTLSYGLSVLDSGEPVTCSVMIDDGTGLTVIDRQKVSDETAWTEKKIKLARWEGRKVKMTFRTEGDKNGVAFWSSPKISTPRSKRFNVVIYLEDALRADHLQAYGYPRPTSTNRGLFAGEGALFKNSFSQGSKTRISCSSIMTGLYPTATGIWQSVGPRLSSKHLTLAEVMRSQGFVTGAFVQNLNAGYSVNLHQGYSSSYTFGTVASTGEFTRKAEFMMGEPLWGWLEDNRDNNFYLYVHILDPHGPYDPSPEFRNWYDEESGGTPVEFDRLYDAPWVKNPTAEGRADLYDGEISYNDSYFVKFTDKLKELGIYDDTLIIFVGDHGEYLGEHGLWNHRPPGFRQVIGIPIIMVYPGRIPANRVVEENVQLIDVMPTILEYAGIDTSEMLLEGDSLVGLMEGRDPEYWKDRVVVSDEVYSRYDLSDSRTLGSVFYRDRHYVSTFVPEGDSYYPAEDRMLFDMVNDRIELNPIKGGGLSTDMHDFLGKLQANNMQIRDNVFEKVAIEADPEARKQLKALGYVQ